MSFFFPKYLFTKKVSFDHFNEAQLTLLKSELTKHEIDITAYSPQFVKFYIPVGRGVTNWNLMCGYEQGVIACKKESAVNLICYQLKYGMPMITGVITLFPIAVLWLVTALGSNEFNWFFSFAMLLTILFFPYFLGVIRHKLYFNRLIGLLEKNNKRYHEEV